MNHLRKLQTASFGLIFIFAASGCKKPVEACFEYTASETNFSKVYFNSDCSEGAVAYDWEFGDGETSIAANPSHFYPQPGEYTATLRITSEKGKMSTTTQWLEIENQCVVCICYAGEELVIEDEYCDSQQNMQAFCQSCLSISGGPLDCTCE